MMKNNCSSNNLEIRQVPFMGAELMAARDNDGQIWAGVKWMCNGIGLTKSQKDTQVQNIQKDDVLMRGCLKFQAGVFDPNNETLALKLEYVPLWLAKISITPTMKRDAPDVADKLVQYQLKAKDVLADAFLGNHGNQTPALPPDYPSALRALADEVEKNMALAEENQRQAKQIESFEPVQRYVDVILSSKKTMTVTQIAADYNISAIRLNQILNEERVQRKVGGQWILYRDKMGKGYTDSKTVTIPGKDGEDIVKVQTRWTQRGRLFIYDLLKARGILPAMEREVSNSVCSSA